MPENRSPLVRALLIALFVLAVIAVALGTLLSPDAEAGSLWAGWNWR